MEKESSLRRILYSLSPVIVLILLLGGAEMAIVKLDIPSWLIVPPSTILKALFSQFGIMFPFLQTTLLEIFLGYVLGVSTGIALALVFTSNPFLDRAISPYVVFLIVTPQIIMVPILMLWLGFGIQVKVLAVALSSFPINMMSTMTGVRSVTPERYELMKSLSASKLQTFFRVLIPSALPNVFTGMRLATIFATTSAIGAELISGNTGIGPQISYNTEFIRMDMAFAYVTIMVVVGIVFYSLISVIEHQVIRWKT